MIRIKCESSVDDWSMFRDPNVWYGRRSDELKQAINCLRWLAFTFLAIRLARLCYSVRPHLYTVQSGKLLMRKALQRLFPYIFCRNF